MNDTKLRSRARTRHRSLPPHSWEALPRTKVGEVHRRLIVILVSIAAVVILLLLFFYGARVVGKAHQFTFQDNTVSVEYDSGKIVVTATLAPGIKTNGVYFELTSSDVGLYDLCEDLEIENSLDWTEDLDDDGVPDNDFYSASCAEGTITFADATINDEQVRPETGSSVDLARLITAPPAEVTLVFNRLDVYDSATGRDLFPNEPVTLTLSVQACTPGQTRSCGFNTVGACQLGTETCQADGTWGIACVGAVNPSPEICDGIDNNCDGTTDTTNGVTVCTTDQNCGAFGNACLAGQSCINGVCTVVAPECGDGDADPGEECDDDNDVNTDACTNQCLTATCGDGFVYATTDAAGEECDDGNTNNNDACTNACTNAVCGDDIVYETVEECDGTDFAGQSCEDYLGVGAGGALLCRPALATDGQPCTIDDSGCLEPPECTAGQTQPCGIQVGICTFGQQSCANGAWGACTGGIIPVEETCDGLDNDCDGSTDEGCPMTLGSPAFGKGEVLPVKYTCEANVPAKNPTPALPTNPPLLISNMPQGTESLALFLEDADQPKQGRPVTVHWAVYNIPVPPNNPATTVDESRTVVIPENYPGSTPGILQAQNDVTQQQNYAPPCPPAGASHKYYFKVYALHVPNIVNTLNINLQNILTATAFADKASGNVIQDAALISYYPTKPAATAAAAPAAGGGGSGGGEVRGGGLVGWNCPKDWSSCTNGQQQRTCQDMFVSGITRLEKRPCALPVTAPPAPKPAVVTPPAKPVVQPPAPPKPIVIQPSPLAVKAPLVQKPVSVLAQVKELWQKYRAYAIAVPSALVVIITLILLLHHFRKPKIIYNVEELKEWIKAEKAMGTSDENVKAILAQNTGWGKEEIETALQEAAGRSSETAPETSPTLPPATPPSS